LFYFHTFPVYFLLANLLIVPLSSIILYLGIFFLLFSFWSLVATWIAFLLKYTLFGLNWFVLSIDKWPSATISDIYMDNINMVMLYFIIFGITYILINKDLRPINMVLISVLIFACNLSFTKISCATNKKIIISKIGQIPVISIVDGARIIYITSSDKIDLLLKNNKNFKTGNFISKEKIVGLESIKIKSDTLINGIRIFRNSDKDYLIGFKKRYVYISNNITFDRPVNDGLILVVNSINVLKKINPENLLNIQIVALNDRNPMIREHIESNMAVFKNAYFINKRGAFFIEL
jgi:hypothetical protein